MKRYFILLFIAINMLAYNFFDNTYYSLTNKYLENKLANMQNHYALAGKTLNSYSKLIFHNAIQTEEIYQIIKYLPDSSDAQKDYIRKQLYQYFLSYYEDLKKNNNIRQVHFHLPDGRSFLKRLAMIFKTLSPSLCP